MKQRGVSFLEVIVVVAILLVASAFVSPSIMDWRAKRNLEADYLSLVSTIDFLKTRVRTINGTGLLICNPNSVLTYQISSNPQSTASAVSGSSQHRRLSGMGRSGRRHVQAVLTMMSGRMTRTSPMRMLSGTW